MSTAREYLGRCLELDLVEEPATLFELRRQYREPPAAAAPVEDREVLEASLARTAEEFYELSDDELQRRLDLELAAYPDLERYRARLRRVADVLDSVERALEDPSLSTRFSCALRDALIARRSEAVGIKQELLKALSAVGVRKQAIRSVKHLRAEYPEVYALEEPWFDEIRAAKRRVKDSSPVRKAGLGFFGVYVIIKIISAIVRAFSE